MCEDCVGEEEGLVGRFIKFATKFKVQAPRHVIGSTCTNAGTPERPRDQMVVRGQDDPAEPRNRERLLQRNARAHHPIVFVQKSYTTYS
jgi:hypothetical protein